ncbi:MAG: PQQ-binding-like beta-propeller repeat protein, partial [Acidobacteriota bacterium]
MKAKGFIEVAAAVLCLLVIALVSSTAAQDSPQWRGPNRDGSVVEFAPPKAWPEQLKNRWRLTIGEGHSSPVVVGTRVFVHSRVGEQEVVAGYELATGKEAWKDSYPVAYQMNPAARGHGKGPKSTPVASDGRLYTLGISGMLSCYDLSSGRVRWRKDFAGQFKQISPAFGTAMSPIVDRGLLIAHFGGEGQGALMALDAATGAVKWSWTGEGPAYASPIAIELGGVRQIVTQSQVSIIGVAEADGQLLWKIPFKTDYEQNSVTPIGVRDTIILSGLNQGVIALRPVKRGAVWQADRVWENSEVSLYMSSPVLSGNTLFGFSHRNKGQYFSLDVSTGKTIWIGDGRQGENAAILLAGNLLFTLNNEGQLTIFPATPKLTA